MSNRLPYRFEDDGEGGFELERSVGGLATGLGPLHEQDGNLWIGWADADARMGDDERARLARWRSLGLRCIDAGVSQTDFAVLQRLRTLEA